MLQDAGIEAAPTNWDELRATAEAVTDQTGQPAVAYPAEFARFYPFLLQAGGSVTNPETTELTIDSDATTQALQFYYDLYKDGLAATPPDVGAEWPGDALVKELGAVAFEGNWFFPFKKENAPDLDLGIAELPAGPGGKGSPAFTVAYAVSANTEVADAACKLVGYLAGPEGMWAWTSSGLAMPSRPDLADRWVEMFPEREPYIRAGEYARGWQFGPGTNQFINDANAVLQSLFADEITVDEARQQLVERARQDIQLGQGAPATPAS